MAKTSDAALKALMGRAQKAWGDNFQSFDLQQGPNLPEGDYEMQIDSAKLDVNRDNDPFVVFRFIVQGGEYEGTQAYDRHTINERGRRTIPQALQMLSAMIQRLGYQVTGLNSPQKLKDVLEKITKDKNVYTVFFEPNEYGGNLRIRGLSNGQPDESEPPFDDTQDVQDEVDTEEGDSFLDDDDGGEEDSSWQVGDWVTVNDPNDEDCPWDGEIKEILNNEEADICADADGETWSVRMEYLTAYSEE